MSDELRAAYSKGYAAGKRIAKQKKSLDVIQRQKNAFWQRAFISTLPWALETNGWTLGGEPTTAMLDRVRLATIVADEALKRAIKHF